ncbi:MAG: zinc-dependent metalloprotease [Rhodothermia bacterium]|nr:zinc-dependent metalloprotease [Rhodothermia bacterium]
MRPLVTLSLLCVVGFTGCTTVNLTPSGESAASKPAATASSAKKDDDKKSPFKDWKETLKDTRAIDGFFKTHLKRDNTLYMELSPDQLNEEFGLIMHFSRGTGVFGLHDGLPLSDSRLMRFERHGDKIYLVHRNHRFTADAGSPMETSLADNTGHSIVNAFDIVSEDSTKSLLIDATELLVSDYSDVADRIKSYFGNKPASFDKGRSYVDEVHGFQRNVEIDALLTYKTTAEPQYTSAGVSDYRSVPIGVRYSFFKLPEDPMMVRYADDRVGYFLDAVKDFSRDKEYDPYVALVSRWRLEKKDHAIPVSEPVKPITFYIDHSVPVEYRKYVKEGIEAWNKGFEAAGFKNAIVGVQAPDDSTWSAEDVRYSTVRWTAAHSMGYAIGPSQTDPRTGEILNADVLISSTFVRGWSNEYTRFIGEETVGEWLNRADEIRASMPPFMAERMCVAEMGKAHQIGFQHAALSAMGVIAGTEPIPDDYLGDAIRDLIMHEVGHTLGLRHNFRSSSSIPYDRLNDKSFTEENGLTASVMDYNTTNISPDRSRQGHYTNPSIGAYDVWAIQFGYATMYSQDASGELAMTGSPVTTPEAELVGLRKVANQSSEPLLAYNTDEDTHLGAMGVDPKTNAWDLSSEPLRYAQDRARLVEMIQPRIEERMIYDGEPYERLRGTFARLIFERIASTRPVVRTIGGLEFSRDHKNTPGARPPFTPVSAASQREALAFVSENVFSADAFEFEADLLNKLAPNRMAHWGSGYRTVPVDFPIHSYLSGGQRSILSDLLHNGRLARMIDNEVRTPGEIFTVAELMQTLTRDIWTEISNPASPRTANSFRRNLQRMYVDQLTAIMLDLRPSPSTLPAPEDARSLARLELMELSNRIGGALESSSLDRTMRAHLTESKVRIDEALDISVTVQLD